MTKCCECQLDIKDTDIMVNDLEGNVYHEPCFINHENPIKMEMLNNKQSLLVFEINLNNTKNINQLKSDLIDAIRMILDKYPQDWGHFWDWVIQKGIKNELSRSIS